MVAFIRSITLALTVSKISPIFLIHPHMFPQNISVLLISIRYMQFLVKPLLLMRNFIKKLLPRCIINPTTHTVFGIECFHDNKKLRVDVYF